MLPIKQLSFELILSITVPHLSVYVLQHKKICAMKENILYNNIHSTLQKYVILYIFL